MGIKVGICGVRGFGTAFIKLFQVHPQVDEVVLADLIPERVAARAKEFGVKRTFASLDELCKSDVDAIALFTPRWSHGPQAVQALKAGKHVYSAVPAAATLEELSKLVETVKETGLMYMLGETSYHRPQTIYCRERFSEGDFGQFVYGEGQYYHDMSRFYRGYMSNSLEDWRKVASFPPMLYPTHSVAFILSVTFRRMAEVSCLGFVDNHEDGIFRSELSKWQNVFSNETGLFRTSDGGMARINEFRRISLGGRGDNEDRMNIMGTLGSYQEHVGSSIWTSLGTTDNIYKDGEIGYENVAELTKIRTTKLDHIHAYKGVEITAENLGDLPKEYIGSEHVGATSVHHVERLPKEFVGLSTGHGGTHQFLVLDFMEACMTGKLPPNNVWLAARYNAPGIVAHESAKRDGELLKIPDFGMPPPDQELLDPISKLKE
ncbi:Gfo/Idh/MocA family protein [Candidatus Poribacteria bacterium]